MENIPKNKLLDYHPDTLQYVRKMFGLEDPKRMEEAIDILQEWASKQEHFTATEFDRIILEKIIMMNKGMLERSKLTLDKICTIRTLMPELFPIKIEESDLNAPIKDAVLPKLTPDYYRVVLIKNYGTFNGAKSFMDFYIKHMRLWQYLMRHDYNAGYILVFDLTQADVMEIIKSMNLSDTKKFMTAVTKVYGARMRAMYVVTTSKFVNMLFDVVKPLLSTKMANRLEVVPDIEGLKDKIPVDILPSDFGGKAKPFSELCDDVVKVLSSDDHIKFLEKMSAYKTDESRRRDKEKFSEDYLGIPGTFRTLNVD